MGLHGVQDRKWLAAKWAESSCGPPFVMFSDICSKLVPVAARQGIWTMYCGEECLNRVGWIGLGFVPVWERCWRAWDSKTTSARLSGENPEDSIQEAATKICGAIPRSLVEGDTKDSARQLILFQQGEAYKSITMHWNNKKHLSSGFCPVSVWFSEITKSYLSFSQKWRDEQSLASGKSM